MAGDLGNDDQSEDDESEDEYDDDNNDGIGESGDIGGDFDESSSAKELAINVKDKGNKNMEEK